VFQDSSSAAERARHAADVLTMRYSAEPWLDRYERVYEAALANAKVR
jgi:hypothetical protein